MKKALLLLIMAACAFIIIACSEEGQTDARGDLLFDRIDGEGKLTIYRDNESGCEYLIYSERLSNGAAGGLTPRLNKSGAPKCTLN